MVATLMLITLLVLRVGAQLQGYNCSQEPHQKISLTTVADCPVGDSISLVTAKEARIVALETIIKVQVPRCHLVLHLTVTHCGMHSHQSLLQGRHRHDVGLTESACSSMHVTRFWSFGKSKVDLKIGLNHGSFLQGGTIDSDSGDCQGDRIEHYEYAILLTTEEVSISIPERTLTTQGVTLELKHPCDAALGCYVTREVPTFTCDSGTLLEVYRGEIEEYTVSDRTIVLISGEQQGALELKDNSVVCNLALRRTNEQRLFYTTDMTRPLPLAGKMDLPMYMSAQMSYLHYTAATDRHQIVRRLGHDLCEVERRVIMNTLSILRKEPDVISHLEYDSFMGKGTSGMRAGEVLYLFECNTISVQARTTGNICYEYMAVMAEGRPMFLKPFSHHLVESAPEMSCMSPIRPLYQIGSHWFDAHTKQGVASPYVLEPSSRQRHNYSAIYRPSGLMTKASFEAFVSSLQSQSRRTTINSVITDAAQPGAANRPHGPEYDNALETLGLGIAAFATFLEKLGAWFGLMGGVILLITIIKSSYSKFSIFKIMTDAGVSIKNKLLALFCFDSFSMAELLNSKIANRAKDIEVAKASGGEQNVRLLSVYPVIDNMVTYDAPPRQAPTAPTTRSVAESRAESMARLLKK